MLGAAASFAAMAACAKALDRIPALDKVFWRSLFSVAAVEAGAVAPQPPAAPEAAQGGHEVAPDGAADAAVGELDQVLLGPDHESVVDAHLAELVDEDRVTPAAGPVEYVVEEGGLAGTEPAADQDDGEAGVGREGLHGRVGGGWGTGRRGGIGCRDALGAGGGSPGHPGSPSGCFLLQVLSGRALGDCDILALRTPLEKADGMPAARWQARACQVAGPGEGRMLPGAWCPWIPRKKTLGRRELGANYRTRRVPVSGARDPSTWNLSPS